HCHQPLKLNQCLQMMSLKTTRKTSAWKLTSAHWESGQAQEGVFISWKESGIENIQYGDSGGTLCSGKISSDNPHNYILLGTPRSSHGTFLIHSLVKKMWTIPCVGPLDSINNFRLGSLPTVPICWCDISTAWGDSLAALCPNTIGLTFQRYQLIPRGGHSYLRGLTEDSVEVPLFCGGEKSDSVDDKLDQAMMTFLDCVQQFKEEAGKGELGLCLPYGIHVEKA
ncbi:Beclin-2, partial [Galemys pyrenaicus]